MFGGRDCPETWRGMLPDQVQSNLTLRRKHPEPPDRYDAFLQELKERIRRAQVR